MEKSDKPVFTSSMFDFENVDTNNNKTEELFNRIANSGDDRSKVILAGIIVEYYFDRILKLILVDFKALTDRSDFTFSLKIAILKSLRLIPNNIIFMCDCVRKVRNEFAHNLEIDSIENIDKKIKTRIHQLYIENSNQKEDISLIKEFESIYRLGSGNLRTYEQNVKLLREKIDDPNFEKELQNINQKRIFDFHEALIKNGPIKIIERGNEIEEIYPKNLSIIKKKK